MKCTVTIIEIRSKRDTFTVNFYFFASFYVHLVATSYTHHKYFYLDANPTEGVMFC